MSLSGLPSFILFIINFSEDGVHKRLHNLYKVLPITEHAYTYAHTKAQTKTNGVQNRVNYKYKIKWLMFHA